MVKVVDFFNLLLRRPDEACGRLEGIADSRLESLWRKLPNYHTSNLASVCSSLHDEAGLPVDEFLAEPALREIENQVQSGLDELPEDAPFPKGLNGDFAMARLCYALCRALRPLRVVETGVCYGVTSAFFLQALRQNDRGMLYSIDLPPLGRDASAFVGRLVPEDLRSRWELLRGTSRRLLPRLLKRIGTVDLFIHDSLHTRRNMRRELRNVTPYLSSTAVVLSDDIEGNSAFCEWAEAVKPRYWAALQQQDKSSLLGVAVASVLECQILPRPQGSVVSRV